MARKTIPATCYHCEGATVLYRSALGDHRRTEFRVAELLEARAGQRVTDVQCPVCLGRGSVDVLVWSRGDGTAGPAAGSRDADHELGEPALRIPWGPGMASWPPPAAGL